MSNTSQKLITIEDLKRATTIADLRRLWELSKQPNSCQSPMSEMAAGGKLIEACIKNADTCKSAEEAKEIFEALAALGVHDTPIGRQLLNKVAFGKWIPLANESEAAEAMEFYRAVIPI